MYPFLDDAHEQDVILDLLEKGFASLHANKAVSKQFVAGKDHQAKLEDQKACLKQSKNINIEIYIKHKPLLPTPHPNWVLRIYREYDTWTPSAELKIWIFLFKKRIFQTEVFFNMS